MNRDKLEKRVSALEVHKCERCELCKAFYAMVDYLRDHHPEERDAVIQALKNVEAGNK